MSAEELVNSKALEAARTLASMVEEAIKSPPLSGDYGLCDRMWKACLLTMSSLSKGFESSKKDSIAFLSEAKRSAGDLRAHLHTAFDQGHIDRGQFDCLYSQAIKVSRKIVDSIRNQIKGREKSKPAPD